MKTYQSTTNRNRITLNQRTRRTVPINFVVMLIANINYIENSVKVLNPC